MRGLRYRFFDRLLASLRDSRGYSFLFHRIFDFINYRSIRDFLSVDVNGTKISSVLGLDMMTLTYSTNKKVFSWDWKNDGKISGFDSDKNVGFGLSFPFSISTHGVYKVDATNTTYVLYAVSKKGNLLIDYDVHSDSSLIFCLAPIGALQLSSDCLTITDDIREAVLSECFISFSASTVVSTDTSCNFYSGRFSLSDNPSIPVNSLSTVLPHVGGNSSVASFRQECLQRGVNDPMVLYRFNNATSFGSVHHVADCYLDVTRVEKDGVTTFLTQDGVMLSPGDVWYSDYVDHYTFTLHLGKFSSDVYSVFNSNHNYVYFKIGFYNESLPLKDSSIHTFCIDKMSDNVDSLVSEFVSFYGVSTDYGFSIKSVVPNDGVNDFDIVIESENFFNVTFEPIFKTSAFDEDALRHLSPYLSYVSFSGLEKFGFTSVADDFFNLKLTVDGEEFTTKFTPTVSVGVLESISINLPLNCSSYVSSNIFIIQCTDVYKEMSVELSSDFKILSADTLVLSDVALTDFAKLDDTMVYKEVSNKPFYITLDEDVPYGIPYIVTPIDVSSIKTSSSGLQYIPYTTMYKFNYSTSSSVTVAGEYEKHRTTNTSTIQDDALGISRTMFDLYVKQLVTGSADATLDSQYLVNSDVLTSISQTFLVSSFLNIAGFEFSDDVSKFVWMVFSDSKSKSYFPLGDYTSCLGSDNLYSYIYSSFTTDDGICHTFYGPSYDDTTSGHTEQQLSFYDYYIRYSSGVSYESAGNTYFFENKAQRMMLMSNTTWKHRTPKWYKSQADATALYDNIVSTFGLVRKMLLAGDSSDLVLNIGAYGSDSGHFNIWDLTTSFFHKRLTAEKANFEIIENELPLYPMNNVTCSYKKDSEGNVIGFSSNVAYNNAILLGNHFERANLVIDDYLTVPVYKLVGTLPTVTNDVFVRYLSLRYGSLADSDSDYDSRSFLYPIAVTKDGTTRSYILKIDTQASFRITNNHNYIHSDTVYCEGTDYSGSPAHFDSTADLCFAARPFMLFSQDFETEAEAPALMTSFIQYLSGIKKTYPTFLSDGIFDETYASSTSSFVSLISLPTGSVNVDSAFDSYTVVSTSTTKGFTDNNTEQQEMSMYNNQKVPLSYFLGDSNCAFKNSLVALFSDGAVVQHGILSMSSLDGYLIYLGSVKNGTDSLDALDVSLKQNGVASDIIYVDKESETYTESSIVHTVVKSYSLHSRASQFDFVGVDSSFKFRKLFNHQSDIAQNTWELCTLLSVDFNQPVNEITSANNIDAFYVPDDTTAFTMLNDTNIINSHSMYYFPNGTVYSFFVLQLPTFSSLDVIDDSYRDSHAGVFAGSGTAYSLTAQSVDYAYVRYQGTQNPYDYPFDFVVDDKDFTIDTSILLLVDINTKGNCSFVDSFGSSVGSSYVTLTLTPYDLSVESIQSAVDVNVANSDSDNFYPQPYVGDNPQSVYSDPSTDYFIYDFSFSGTGVVTSFNGKEVLFDDTSTLPAGDTFRLSVDRMHSGYSWDYSKGLDSYVDFSTHIVNVSEVVKKFGWESNEDEPESILSMEDTISLYEQFTPVRCELGIVSGNRGFSIISGGSASVVSGISVGGGGAE